MSLDGVDISTHVPKTIQELATSLASSSSPNKNHVLRTQEPAFHKQQPENIHGEEPDACDLDMMMDKLIVLCSCGDEMKSQLVRRAVSVEEWNVDAPTAAAQSGEGASAYRRVSQDIRLKVHYLMEQILHEKTQQQQLQHELRIEQEQVNIGMEDVLTSEAAGAVLSGKEIISN
jgi:protein-tyrosine-phosphatase